MRVSSRSEEAKSESSEKASAPHKRRHKAPEAEISHAPAAKSGEDEEDAKVNISTKAKTSQSGAGSATHDAKPTPADPKPRRDTSDKELTSAELLMEHVNSGQLSGEEQELAMKRVGEIVKKYGKA